MAAPLLLEVRDLAVEVTPGRVKACIRDNIL
jgi:hypothetical protein